MIQEGCLRPSHHQEYGPRSSPSMEDSTNPDESEASATKTTASKTEDEHSETSESIDQKPLKKPDKILPCPRCKSKETKFCYYNNYNAHQPRHFCKNCQRYWTAGGTMRNVPVGAGRRKSKTSISDHRHLIVPETLVRISVDPNGLSNPNGTVQIQGGHEDYTKSPSYLAFPFPPQTWPSADLRFQFYHGPPPICAPGFTMPFYSTYLACDGSGAWPYVPTTSSDSQTGLNSGLNPQTLGKHPRNEETLNSNDLLKEDETNAEKCIWVPKIQRIDDPGKAAKSSIWTSLGFKKEMVDSVSRNCFAEASHHFMRANPAALSRSHNFHESS